MKKYSLFFSLLILLSGCVSKQREDELLAKVQELETKLDECENGDEKLYAGMIRLYELGDYQKCKSLFSEMETRHPDSELFQEAKEIYNKIIQLEVQEQLEARKRAESLRAKQMKALDKLRKNYDDVDGITWHEQSYFIHYNNRNLISIYFGDNGYRQWLRLKMSYEGDNWIFFEKAYLSYDGNTLEIPFDSYEEKKTENDGGSVWEWIDVSVSDNMLKYLRDFSQSKNAKMRLSGKYTKTRNLTWNERRGIRDVLDGYDALSKAIK